MSSALTLGRPRLLASKNFLIKYLFDFFSSGDSGQRCLIKKLIKIIFATDRKNCPIFLFKNAGQNTINSVEQSFRSVVRDNATDWNRKNLIPCALINRLSISRA